MTQKPQRLDGFSESHFIRKNASQVVDCQKIKPIDAVLLVGPQRFFQRPERDRFNLPEFGARTPLAFPSGRTGQRHRVVRRNRLDIRRVSTIDPVDPRLALLRLAIREHLLKLVEQRGIKDRRHAASQTHGVAAGLNQALDFRSGKAFPVGSGQLYAEFEPIFPGASDFQLRADALHIAGYVRKTLPDGDFPLLLQARKVTRKESDDGRFSTKLQFSRARRDEAGGV